MLKKFKRTELYKNYRKMWPFIKPYRGIALLTMLMSVPIGALEASIAMLLKPFMDTVLIEKSASASFIPLIIIGITIIQSLLAFSSNMLNAYVGQKISIDIKEKMFKKLLGKEAAFFDKTSSGQVSFDFGGNVDGACSGLLTNVKSFVTRVCTSFFLILVLFWNSWQLSIVALLVLFFAMVPLSNVRKRISKVTKAVLEKVGSIGTYYNEVFRGHKVISTYNMQDEISSDFRGKMDELFRLHLKAARRTGSISPIMNILVAIGIAGVIWMGGSLIENGSITPGNFVSFIVCLMMLYTPIKKMGNLFAGVQVSIISMARMFKTYEAKTVIKDKKDAKKLTKPKQDIVFENVDFSYDGVTPVLKNVSLNIEIGKTFAFVGNSGGGKSTLVNLIPRFYDILSGSIKIDGKDIRGLTVKSLRDQISIVFQDTFLFRGTLKRNLLVGNLKATKSQIEQAIKSSCLEEFVSSLPKGLNTQVGEMGSLLSGGQKQRIAIARAFLKDSPIVILDEATSALDNKSEKVVQDAIGNLMKDRTVLVIAHRLSTVRHADKIIVVDHGEIVEQGSHNQLIKNPKGVYNSLYKTQLD